MSEERSDQRIEGWYRRGFMQAAGVATMLGSGAGVVGAQEGGNDDGGTGRGQQSGNRRIDTSRRVSPRDFANHNYERIYSARKKEAIEVLLRDPMVNEVASNWVASFQAHEPLTNHLDMVSIQGPEDVRIEGNLDRGVFDITAASRRTIYGIVDRWENELLALEATEPRDVPWQEDYSEDQTALDRGRFLTQQQQVRQHLDGNQWYPMFKVGESITSAYGLAHMDVSPVLFVVNTGEGVAVVSTFVDVSGEELELVHVGRIEDFVDIPVQQLARQITPDEESVEGQVPGVPFENRPFYTANEGFHRFEEPDRSFEQNGWSIEWQPPETQGITIRADYNGKPVFAALDNPVTYTGYMLPPREGRNISDWYFPDDDPLFAGSLLYWDIHSVEFGGPGMIGKIDYPETGRHPGGFRLKTHYHTGAQGRQSVDFHSGMQFGPYNYDISHEFFSDGEIRPIWRRQGPGYATEHKVHMDEVEWSEGDEMVIQHYTSATAFDVTPGTTDGVETLVFDGNEWQTRTEEFYLEGEPGMKVRFTNPNGSETVDIVLDGDTEIVVVRPKENEIGPGEGTATRTMNPDVERAFYHPEQYADGESIQGERVVVWLLLEAATGEMPHYAGISSFAVPGEIHLHGYGSDDGGAGQGDAAD